MNLLEVVGILKGLSKEDRGRCMRSVEIDEELSSMSGRNSGGGTAEGLNLTPATVLTVNFCNFNFSLVGSEEISKVFFFFKKKEGCM